MTLALALAAALAQPAAVPADVEARVRAAIVRSVQERMGGDAEVFVDELVIIASLDGDPIAAAPEPDARLGRKQRFLLSAPSQLRTGLAEARVRVVLSHAHAARDVSAGSELGEQDVQTARHEVTSGLLAGWLSADAAVGARLRRPLRADDCVTRALVSPRIAVRSGQTVQAIVRTGGVLARTTVVASASGNPGSIIRVVNRQSRRALRARVVSNEIVEIVQ